MFKGYLILLLGSLHNAYKEVELLGRSVGEPFEKHK